MPEFSPISPSELARRIAERARAHSGRVLVGVDGADAADPTSLADLVVTEIARRGAAHRISLHDYVRPASLRFEYGKTDELSYRTAWFDFDGLGREVIEPLRATGTWLPALWNEASDRSPRARIRTAAADTEVLVIAGPMLLGRDLDLDVTVQLVMSEGALRRRTSADELWTIAPLLEHAATVTEHPDFMVRWEHPDRPALAV